MKSGRGQVGVVFCSIASVASSGARMLTTLLFTAALGSLSYAENFVGYLMMKATQRSSERIIGKWRAMGDQCK